MASHFLCEGLTPALSLYTSCHLLSWYSHKVVCKITYMHEYIIHVYSLSFQGQECSVTNADGIMETSQTISSRITDEHTSQLFFFFPLHHRVVLLSQLHYVSFENGKSQYLSWYLSGFSEIIYISPGTGSCCYHNRDSPTMTGMTSALPSPKQVQKKTNSAAVVQQPKSATKKTQRWLTTQMAKREVGLTTPQCAL